MGLSKHGSLRRVKGVQRLRATPCRRVTGVQGRRTVGQPRTREAG